MANKNSIRFDSTGAETRVRPRFGQVDAAMDCTKMEGLLRDVEILEYTALDCRQHSVFGAQSADELIRAKIDEIKRLQEEMRTCKDEMVRHKILSRYTHIINRYLL